MIHASDVSARIAALLERHHPGDRGAAARRLGVDPHRLAGLLSGDWRQFSLDTMAALTIAYGVSASWLLSVDERGAEAPSPPRRRDAPTDAAARGHDRDVLLSTRPGNPPRGVQLCQP